MTLSKFVHHNCYLLVINIRTVLGKTATGGGRTHLEEQITRVNVPSLSQPHFLAIERALGTMFEEKVTKGVCYSICWKKEKKDCNCKKNFCDLLAQ